MYTVKKRGEIVAIYQGQVHKIQGLSNTMQIFVPLG